MPYVATRALRLLPTAKKNKKNFPFASLVLKFLCSDLSFTPFFVLFVISLLFPLLSVFRLLWFISLSRKKKTKQKQRYDFILSSYRINPFINE
jgi:hypothetical protein